MRNYEKWFVTCGLLAVFSAHAVVYKCVDENQSIHYQKKACKEQQESSVMNVNEEETESIDYSVQQKAQVVKYPKVDNKQSIIKQTTDDYRQAHQRQCRKLRSEYKNEQKSVVQKCKNDRDIYCNQTAAKIERIKLNRDISETYRNYNGKGHPRPYPPKLFQIKNQLKINGC